MMMDDKTYSELEAAAEGLLQGYEMVGHRGPVRPSDDPACWRELARAGVVSLEAWIGDALVRTLDDAAGTAASFRAGRRSCVVAEVLLNLERIGHATSAPN